MTITIPIIIQNENQLLQCSDCQEGVLLAETYKKFRAFTRNNDKVFKIFFNDPTEMILCLNDYGRKIEDSDIYKSPVVGDASVNKILTKLLQDVLDDHPDRPIIHKPGELTKYAKVYSDFNQLLRRYNMKMDYISGEDGNVGIYCYYVIKGSTEIVGFEVWSKYKEGETLQHVSHQIRKAMKAIRQLKDWVANKKNIA